MAEQFWVMKAGRGGPLGEIEELLHRLAPADHVAKRMPLLAGPPEHCIFIAKGRVEPGVFNGDGSMVRKGFQETEILLLEPDARALAVEIDGADDPVADAERNAHQGLDVEKAHRAEVTKPLILLRVESQYGLPPPGLAHDALRVARGVGDGLTVHAAGHSDLHAVLIGPDQDQQPPFGPHE
jgi:hypothetical protein